ncbi:helix-turn-helix domain-containing protein [Intrasporangium sp.]|uniref:helix-turn-helix domain-containing protein n=1 Tax=Intrasporangium sp. TaxID=1925024 RepID=UPI0032219AB6
MAAKQGRAAPMTPDARREALVDVYVRLARRYARRPTSNEIAHEAGVAEGTIYRAFGTKDELETEAVQAAFCPGPVRRLIAAIDPGLPARQRLVEFTRIMQERFTDVFELMAALGLTEPPERNGHDQCFLAGHHRPGAAGSRTRRPVHQPLLDSMHELVADLHDELTVEPAEVIHRIRLLTFSASHPGIADGRLLSPEQIVATVLDGLRVRAEAGVGGIPGNRVDPHAGGGSTVEADRTTGRTHPNVAEARLHALNRKGS